MQETQRLLAIMAKLRDPNGGCPWDVEQDFASIAPYTLEEAYEVVDAIERNDMADLKEELGDLLLQVVFHSQMASEAGFFDFEDVAQIINEKMVRRHPHIVFDSLPHSPTASAVNLSASRTKGARSNDRASFPKANMDTRSAESPQSGVPSRGKETERGTIIKTAQDQTENWEKIKQQEKADKGHASVLDDVPVGFPAMVRAQKLTKKAARVGFDWDKIDDVFDKLQEEIEELKEAIADSLSHVSVDSHTRSADRASPERESKRSGDEQSIARAADECGDNQKIEEEFGDLLFVCASIARHLKLDGETALRKANNKFNRRFRFIEKQLELANKTLEDSTLEEMEYYWQEAKKKA